MTKNLRNDPVGIFKITGEKYWSKQAEILRAIWKHRKVAVKTCHAIGKSYSITRAGLAWLLSWSSDNIVITTAPTFRQVKKIIWREWHKMIEHSKMKIGGKLNETEYFLTPTAHAFGFSADTTDAAQGIHSTHMLGIIDEAGGVKGEIKAAIDYILTGNHNHLVLIGNPTDPASFFAEAFKLSTYHKITITAFDTPNFKYNRIKTPEQLMAMSREEVEKLPLPCPFLITPLWVWEKIEEWGVDSTPFRVRVMAEFPEEGDDILIPFRLCEASLNLDEEDFKYTTNLRALGVDVARYGTNMTVLTGVDQHKILDIRAYSGKSLMETVGLIIEMFKNLGFSKELDVIVVDDTGVGGGVTDRLREQGYNVIAFNFGGKPKLEHSKINPVNAKTEMYWNVREVMRGEEFKIMDKGKLLSQLSNVRYHITSTDKFEIVSKEDMMKLGYESPDFADSFGLALWGLRNTKGMGEVMMGSIMNNTQGTTF